MNKEVLMSKLVETIISGDESAATKVAQEILTAGVDPMEAIQVGGMEGLRIVGERFQRLDAFLPDLVLAGEAMKACLAVLTPHIKLEQRSELSLGKVVIGTVSGDIHDIGKNIVATMLTITGFEVFDLGIDVTVKQFVAKAEDVGARFIALSALLTSSSYYQEDAIKYLRDAGLREKYYVIVGGAPITGEWAAQVGADGYGRNAVDAVEVFKRIISEGAPPPVPHTVVVE